MNDKIITLEYIIELLEIDIDPKRILVVKNYLDLLFRWHEKNNLISTRDRQYFLKRDFFDSLSMLPYLPKGPFLDVGTGAGIPGILLSFFKKEEKFMLLDRRENAIRFIDHVKLKLDLKNIESIKSDICKMKINEKPNAILIKNFSNKIVSRLSFKEKLSYYFKLFRSDLSMSGSIYMLTGSNAIEVENNINSYSVEFSSKFELIKIKTPFFSTNRFILRISND